MSQEPHRSVMGGAWNSPYRPHTGGGWSFDTLGTFSRNGNGLPVYQTSFDFVTNLHGV